MFAVQFYSLILSSPCSTCWALLSSSSRALIKCHWRFPYLLKCPPLALFRTSNINCQEKIPPSSFILSVINHSLRFCEKKTLPSHSLVHNFSCVTYFYRYLWLSSTLGCWATFPICSFMHVKCLVRVSRSNVELRFALHLPPEFACSIGLDVS